MKNASNRSGDCFWRRRDQRSRLLVNRASLPLALALAALDRGSPSRTPLPLAYVDDLTARLFEFLYCLHRGRRWLNLSGAQIGRLLMEFIRSDVERYRERESSAGGE